MILYRAKHILLEDQEDAEYVLAELAKGKGFEELAIEYSECSTGANGGKLGQFASGSMVPEFERALTKLAINEVSLPIKSEFGFHIIIRLAL